MGRGCLPDEATHNVVSLHGDPVYGDGGHVGSKSAKLWDDVAFMTRVHAIRDARGMTIAELCQRTGCSEAYFRGRPGKARRTEEVLLIADALSVSAAYLMGFSLAPGRSDRLRIFASITAHLHSALDHADDIHTADIIELIMRALDRSPQEQR